MHDVVEGVSINLVSHIYFHHVALAISKSYTWFCTKTPREIRQVSLNE